MVYRAGRHEAQSEDIRSVGRLLLGLRDDGQAGRQAGRQADRARTTTSDRQDRRTDRDSSSMAEADEDSIQK